MNTYFKDYLAVLACISELSLKESRYTKEPKRPYFSASEVGRLWNKYHRAKKLPTKFDRKSFYQIIDRLIELKFISLCEWGGKTILWTIEESFDLWEESNPECRPDWIYDDDDDHSCDCGNENCSGFCRPDADYIYHPVGLLNYFQVMLDHGDDCIPEDEFHRNWLAEIGYDFFI